MHNIFHRKLEIPVKVFNNPFNGMEYSNKRHHHFDLNNFSDDYLSWLNRLNLTLVHAQILYSFPDTPYGIHQDHFKRTDFPKINFIYGGKNSRMNWYKVKPEKLGKIREPEINNPYMTFSEDQVDLIYSQELEGVNLLQAGIPHNLTNDSDPRWCISTVYLLDNKRFLTWPEAVTLFNPFMISD